MLLFWLTIFIFIAIALSFALIPLLGKRSKGLIIAITLFIPLTATALYYYFGAAQQWLDYQQQEARLEELGDSKNVISRLEQRLQQEPDNAEGWFWLGRVYLGEQQYQLAAQALHHAYQLQPDDQLIALTYVQADFLAQQNRLSENSEAILQNIILAQADNLQALNLLALARYEQQQYQQAIAIWEDMLEKYPEDSSEYQVISLLIAEAQQMLE